jgi:hypothetical protein
MTSLSCARLLVLAGLSLLLLLLGHTLSFLPSTAKSRNTEVLS